MPAKKRPEFTREVWFHPAYERGEEGGRHSAEIRFLLRGPDGVVQFLVFSGWHLPESIEAMQALPHLAGRPLEARIFQPTAADLGYHSPKRRYKGQTSMGKCAVLGGRACYYDGSGLNAQPVFDLLIREGHEAVWKELERHYHATFRGA